MTRFAHFYCLAVVTTIVTAAISDTSLATERCELWVGRLLSKKGDVEILRKGKSRWESIRINDIFFCVGDTARIEADSRAAIALINETVLALDQHTVVTFYAPETEKTSLLDLLKGTISSLLDLLKGTTYKQKILGAKKIRGTPFTNGGLEG